MNREPDDYHKSFHAPATDLSKAAILLVRRDRLQKQLDEAQAYIDGLKFTHCGLTCSGCGEHLETEWDFAAHFLVTDTNFLNLGYCPREKAKEDLQW